MNVEYVVGLMFNLELDRVALVRKKQPAWQSGLLNGVGGKVEAGELNITAMRREFLEETGFLQEDWQLFARIQFDPDATVDFFAVKSLYLHLLKTVTDEYVKIVRLSDLSHHKLVAPLHWLTLIARDFLEAKTGIDHIKLFPGG